MVVREVLVTQNLFCRVTENSLVRKTQNYIWSHSPRVVTRSFKMSWGEVTPGTHSPKKGMPMLRMPSGRTPRNLAVSLVPRFRCHLWDGLAAAAAKLLQSCPTLCDPIDGSPPGSHVPGIVQARSLEWVAISFSNAGKWKVKVKLLSCVWLLATRWTAALQTPPSMGLSRQEYWSGVPLPSPVRWA